MENFGITKNSSGLYTATERAKGVRSCARNIEERVGFLSRNPETGVLADEWHVVGVRGYANRTPHELCICGQVIERIYIVENTEKMLVQVGSTCVERFAEDDINDYKRSLRFPFHCDICKRDYVNRAKHLKSAFHSKNHGKFVRVREKTLKAFIEKAAKRVPDALPSQEPKQKPIPAPTTSRGPEAVGEPQKLDPDELRKEKRRTYMREYMRKVRAKSGVPVARTAPRKLARAKELVSSEPVVD